jgi:hypothetical protein
MKPEREGLLASAFAAKTLITLMLILPYDMAMMTEVDLFGTG